MANAMAANVPLRHVLTSFNQTMLEVVSRLVATSAVNRPELTSATQNNDRALCLPSDLACKSTKEFLSWPNSLDTENQEA